jgi:hypothetical protein
MVPIGGIIAWSGAIVDIPAGYHLCDGTAGTPELRDKFIYGSGSSLAVGATGGDVEHDHGAAPTVNCAGTGPSVAAADQFPPKGPNIPPFHSLAYIQRMS